MRQVVDEELVRFKYDKLLIRSMEQLLALPTKPRNKTEEDLLEEIVVDPSLGNFQLRGKVIAYIKDRYSLVAWHHYPATITKYSFEDTILVQATYNSYNGKAPTPRIVGIQTYSDLR